MKGERMETDRRRRVPFIGPPNPPRRRARVLAAQTNTDQRPRKKPLGPCCYPLELWAFRWMETTRALPYIKPAYIAERPWRVLCLRYRDGQSTTALAAQADLWERGRPVTRTAVAFALGGYVLKLLSRGQYGFNDLRALEERARMLTTRFGEEVMPVW